MNVVVKIVSLISQVVYSVATPFHPFGGAVDIIVVQQPDGTFRSMPWYVRFGKFQGVLKGAEKVVRITVNGVEADFHMYLDNSGQAYFLKEDESGKGFETNGDLKDSDGEVVSDSWVAQLRDERDAPSQKQLERAESDTKFYDFQDDQFSQEGLVNFSEYGSDRYKGLDSECFGVAQGLDSVVFFSEDGHILTAPVLASDMSAENMQLSTPLFHIGAGEGPDFCDGNGEFSPGDNESDADYICKLNAAAPNNSSDLVCNLDSDSTALRRHLEVCEKGGEYACQTEETRNLFNHENEFIRQSDIEDASVHIKDDVFKSCLELSELGRHDENTNSEEIGSPLQAQISQDKPSCRPPEVGETEDGAIGGSRNKDVLSSSCSPNYSNENGSPDLPVEKKMLATDYMGSNNASVDLVVNDPELRDEQFDTSAATEGMNSSLQSPPPEDKSKGGDSGVTTAPPGRRWRLWSIPIRRVKTLEKTGSNLSSEEVFLDTESSLQNSPADLIPTSSGRIESPGKQFVRTNIPTNDQIASLNLKNGQNTITFSFSSRVLGTQQVDAHLYLWKWNAKIVISDVDGTITKSDVLGQFMPLVGRDWTQSGVANLFSAIKENGYQLLFLSARAIVQAYLTRSFLLNLKQDGKALPTGPVVISPDGLFPSLYREVIRRTPHEFKIACLKNIRKLFPSDYNPFYAGFGNRDTDELSYKEIGIPKGKRFIINPKGEVAISYCMNTRSYTSLHTLVEEMFPPTSFIEPEDYNEWNYWKVPLQDIE